MYTPSEGPDGMLLERNGKFTMWKSKSSRLSYSLVESLPPLSMMNVKEQWKSDFPRVITCFRFSLAGPDSSLGQD